MYLVHFLSALLVYNYRILHFVSYFFNPIIIYMPTAVHRKKFRMLSGGTEPGHTAAYSSFMFSLSLMS